MNILDAATIAIQAQLPESKLNQTPNVKTFGPFANGKEQVKVKVRYDDTCRNGHNSLGITCDIYERGRDVGGGCNHELIAKLMPEMAPFIKWHLTNTDGPMHYSANALYHVSNRDYNGLLKGEYRSFVYKVLAGDEDLYTSRIFYSFRNWLHRDEAKAAAEKFLDNLEPELNAEIVMVGHGEPSEGKERDLDGARNCAVWPEAEIEDFTKENLDARLPALMREFKRAIEELGFEY